MARAIERIERDIIAMEEAIEAIALELFSAYTNYLTMLGQALQQQLIQATYYVCTQGHPDNFLKLSLNQRQQLQQAIRKLSQKAAQQLLSYMESGEDEEDEDEVDEEDETDEVDEEDEEDEEDETDETDEVDEIDEEDETDEEVSSLSPTPTTFPTPSTLPTPSTFPTSPTSLTTPTFPDRFHRNISTSTPLQTFRQKVSTPTPPAFPEDLSNPVEVAKWQHQLEGVTQETLKKLSRDANVLLQKARILPNKLPEQILEAAVAVSEASGDAIPAPPNLLNLVIEIENEKEPEESSLTQIMALNMRLAEIEFADLTLSSARKQIRNILLQLNKLGREYQKQHRELTVAEAEAAWRASWFED